MENVGQGVADYSGFAVKTNVFTGPLDLLIALIEKRKLLINDISLATVTDDYMRYVAEMERLELRETSQFVVLASTLLLIKSRSLLPVLSLTEEEEDNIDDLQNRLRLYQILKRGAKDIESAFGVHFGFERKFVPSPEPLFLTDKYTEPNALSESIQSVISSLPKKVVRPKVNVTKVISLEDMIDRLRERIEREFKFGFKEFTGNSGERPTIIVGFLAVLEMVKQGKVMVRQGALFNEIEIELEPGNTPRYV